MTVTELKQALTALDCPNQTFGIVADISAGRLSAILNGQRSFENGETDRAARALSRLKALAASTDVPINFRNTTAIKAALDKREQDRERAIFVIKKTLRDLKLWSPTDGFKTHLLAACQVRSRPLSAFTIEKILEGVQATDEEIRILADLVAAIKAIDDSLAAVGGLDVESDIFQIKLALAQECQAVSSPAPPFVQNSRV